MASTSTDSRAAISLPKGGGAIKGIGETFRANAFTGTADFSFPIATSPGRDGFGPSLSLAYSSGHGNGPFGLGWELSIPRVARKTEKGLPEYAGDDVFVLSGAEDLVPHLGRIDGDPPRWKPVERERGGFRITEFRPRTEGLFARIERWTRTGDGAVHWRSITTDNVTSIYGRSASARVADPADAARVFEWLLEETFDRRGNHVLYEYLQEDSVANRPGLEERNRRPAQAYLRSVLYGNTPDGLDPARRAGPTRVGTDHLNGLATRERHYVFQVVFDYGEPALPGPGSGRFPIDAGRFAALENGIVPADWPIREDPFSTYRAGFEIRTLRRCRRILMLHHFREGELDGAPLVKSTDFVYGVHALTRLSFLESVTVSGYQRDRTNPQVYLVRQLPPVTFKYSEFAPHRQRYQPATAEGGDLPPLGLNAPDFALTDLFGDGLPDVLQAAGSGFHYWRNRGEGHFDRRARFAASPPVTLSQRNVAVGDLGGDGLADLLVDDPPLTGFFENTGEGGWARFRRFDASPSLGLTDPDTRLVDLTGDGLSDVLTTRDDGFLWFRCLGEAGYAAPRRIPRQHDLDHFPDVFFSDPAGRVRLADMTGDGLNDIVLLHDGRIEYWPNRGYGRFGPRVTTANAPRIGHDFDPRRLFLVDLDGTGCADLVYVEIDRVRFWFSQSGNGWSQEQAIAGTPRVSDAADVRFADVYGTGTAALVWSYGHGDERESNYKFLDFCGARKPHLLVEMSNNLGATTRVTYASSTKFFLDDRAAGCPWVTNLPFPVQVVQRTEVIDRISRSRLVTRYAYHHGSYDGREREFRGFGMVEQLDTEEFAALAGEGVVTSDNIDAASHVPPVRTRTWFHTGAFHDRDRISRQFAHEYYREPGLSDAEFLERLLPDTRLPDDLEVEEQGEACRALRGSMLREEVFALDGSARQAHPFAVSERDYAVVRLQPREGNRHGVFYVHPRETITYGYERNPADPRVSHTLTLEVDAFGNTLQEAVVGYGRRVADPSLLEADQERQARTLVTYAKAGFTNAILDAPDDHRTPLPCDACTYELVGYAPTGPGGRFQVSDFIQPGSERGTPVVFLVDSDLAYEEAPTIGRQRRLIEHVRTLYRPDDLGESRNDATVLLPTGTVEALAVRGESFQLAFTPGVLSQVFHRNGEPLLPVPADVLGGQGGDQGGYLSSQQLKASGAFPPTDPNDHWWIPTGRVFLSPDADKPAAQERAHATQHFFLTHRSQDPFGHTSRVIYDGYDLLMLETRDALTNRVTAGVRTVSGEIDATRPGNDYRVLQPCLMMDANRNRTQVAFDALGMVVGTAAMGKPEEQLGDSLDGFEANLPDAIVVEFLAAPLAAPHEILGRATSRQVYDLSAYKRTQDAADPLPAVVHSLTREIHDTDLGPGERTRIQHSVSYSDGFGREIQKKGQAEPGPIPVLDASGGIVLRPDGQPETTGETVAPRWVVSGWTIFNNKGNPVRQYEPFFSETHRFDARVEVGVSAILFYDPVGRVVATLHPNHTYEKVVFDAWRQAAYDANDTVAAQGVETGDPRTDPDIAGYVAAYFEDLSETTNAPWQTWHQQREGGGLGPQEQVAAERASAHANTPTLSHFDALGRPFLTIAHNKVVCADHDLDGTEERFHTRVELDVDGNEREVRDATVQGGDPLGRVVMRYAYDMVGNRIHEISMDAGARWLLNDVAGNRIRAWDSRGHAFRAVYDPLRRLSSNFVAGEDSQDPTRELLTERLVYGEQHPFDQQGNLRGRPHLHFDQAGVLTTEACDFKGNVLRASRRLAADYQRTVDWRMLEAALPTESSEQLDLPALQKALAPLVGSDAFALETAFDALGRPVRQTTPDNSVVRRSYNEGSLLQRIDANLRGATEGGRAVWTVVVSNIDYDAKGQRQRVDFGNGASTLYRYDPFTFRLAHLRTRRSAIDFPEDCSPDSPGCDVQNLHYTYDPVGNVTHIRDDAQQTIYFRNKRVDPRADYTYDAIYRLIEATGREHLGQNSTPVPHSHDDAPRVRLPHPNDGDAMARYVERYVYDAAGNFVAMQHQGGDAGRRGWTRGYVYAGASAIEDGTGGTTLKTSNRLTSTMVGSANSIVDRYDHDAHGNVVFMPHLGAVRPANLRWDEQDQLRHADLGGGGTVYFTYDASGRRVRKVWMKTERLIDERIYLGGFEILRKHAGPIGTLTATLERETLHVLDDEERVAVIETRTLDRSGNDPAPPQAIRFLHGNHLGSVSLELDAQGQIVSYEEYAPYGSTTYQAVRHQTETPKRYRHTGVERDEETGFTYHSSRYYAPWVGRWLSPDPAGLSDGPNLYAYVSGAPTRLNDTSGTEGNDPLDEIDSALENMTLDTNVKLDYRQQQETFLNIAEPLTVGETDIPEPQARARALDVDNRTMLGQVTNQVAQGTGVPMQPLPPARTPVSLADDPGALIARRFSEITEMKVLFDRAVRSIRNPGKYKPTVLKGKINAHIRKAIRKGTSAEAVAVRTALTKLRATYVPGKGWRLPMEPRSGLLSGAASGAAGGAKTRASRAALGPGETPAATGPSAIGGRVRGAAIGVAITIGVELVSTGELPPAEDILVAAAAGAFPVLGVITSKNEGQAMFAATLWIAAKSAPAVVTSGAAAVAAPLAMGALAVAGVGWAAPQVGARGMSAHALGAKGGWGNLLCYPGKPGCGPRRR